MHVRMYICIYIYIYPSIHPSLSRVRFTNSVFQSKLSFGVKIVLSGFTKDAQWRISAEKARNVIFAPDLIEYAFLGVSPSDAKSMGGQY